MQFPKFRAWIKSQKKMVEVSKLRLKPETEAGVEYLENSQTCFVPIKDCEVQQALDIFDHSGNQYYFYDIILTKTSIGALVLCDGNLGLATWMGNIYHCFCSISKEELEAAEIIGNIYEEETTDKERINEETDQSASSLP